MQAYLTILLQTVFTLNMKQRPQESLTTVQARNQTPAIKLRETYLVLSEKNYDMTRRMDLLSLTVCT